MSATEPHRPLGEDLPSLANCLTLEDYKRGSNGDRVELESHWWGCPDCGRHHQPRDHSVPCDLCQRPTFATHRVCDRCKASTDGSTNCHRADATPLGASDAAAHAASGEVCQ